MAMDYVQHGGGPRGERGRTCLASDVHRALFAQSRDYRARRREIDAFNSLYGASNAGAGLRTGITIIPVVVHVVWNTTAQNISDAQIQSQIDVLNADYRRLNADAATVPAVFQPVAADARIQFQLAVRDPNCQPTSGIVRRQTTVNGFTVDSNNPTTMAGNPVKFDASGGSDAWPAADYLNIWVCKFADSTLLGYSSFPGFPANVDGVAITYRAFGTIGSLAAGFNLGRTASHEIGHYLNLFHIWGNNQTPVCTDSDDVADTPNQLGPNTGCPTFPHVSCSNGPNGDMFMNYMDYVDDPCMTMFTAGQAARMAATLAGARASLVASEALVPAGLPPDLWSQDVAGDVGAEPDAAPGVMWESDDIWVRTANDGIANQEHQNPEYRIPGSSPNYVYVRVRNRGCAPVAGGTLRLYWAKASTALGWPAPWDGSVTAPALMGQAVGSQATPGLGAGASTILTFPWSPPNPDDYSSFGADQSHFCLLARIETSPTAPFGMTTPETSDLNANVRNNNNIVWKNVTVVDELAGGGRFGAVSIQALEEGIATSLRIHAGGGRPRRSVLQWGRIEIDLGERLFAAWQEGGAVGEGVEPTGDGRIMILKPAASIRGLKLPMGEPATITLRATRRARGVDHNEIFFVDVLQYADDGKSERQVGGQRFVIKTIYRERKHRILDHLPVIHYVDAGIR